MNTHTIEARSPSIDWASFTQSLDWSHVRRPQRTEDLKLAAETSEWLRALPVGARPLQLQKRFPRIANELARLWGAYDALNDYFNSLLVDTRFDREGFPPLVQEELCALQAYRVTEYLFGAATKNAETATI